MDFDFDLGDILWLPPSRSAATIIPFYLLDRPVLILCSQGADIMVCLITTFKSLPLREKFPSHHQRSIRLQHLPLAPADPHPDTNEILSTEWTGTPSVTSRPSYVKLNSILVVPSRLLTPLNGGTAKLSIEALAEVTKKILGDEDLLEDMSNDWRTSLRCVKRAMSAPPLRPAMVVRKAKGPKNLCGKNFWAPLTETCL